MKYAWTACFGVVAVGLSTPALADDAPPTAPPTTTAVAVPLTAKIDNGAAVLVSGDARFVVVPAGVEAVHLVGNRLYVALGRAGAAQYDVTAPNAPKLVARASGIEGKVTGFHDVGSETWMEIETRRAVPAPSAEAGVVAAPSMMETPQMPRIPTPEPPQARAVVRAMAVVGTSPGEVEIDAGRAEGVVVGDRLSVFRLQAVVESRGDYVNRERVAVVEVIAVREHSCLGEVARGARVVVGDAVERAKVDESESLVFPRRLSGLIDFSGTLRPLVNVGTPLGGGVLIDGSATYLGRGYFAGARLQPLGLGGTKDGATVSTSVLAEAGYDARPFAVGLGVGVSAVNGDLDAILGYSKAFDETAGGATTTTATQKTKTAFSLGQVIRLGARDGLNFSLVNVLLYHKKPTGEAGFIYGATTGKLSIPLMQSTDLFAEGGGGFMGYAYGALGVHTWLIGRGDAGSLALSVAAGGAAVWGSREVTVTADATTNSPAYTTTEDITIGGPMASLGFQYRLGL